MAEEPAMNELDTAIETVKNQVSEREEGEAMLEQGMHSGNTDAKFDPPPEPKAGLLGFNAMSGDVENRQILKLWFDHDVTDDDRRELLAAINAHNGVEA